jgi:hypothetical protein
MPRQQGYGAGMLVSSVSSHANVAVRNDKTHQQRRVVIQMDDAVLEEDQCVVNALLR